KRFEHGFLRDFLGSDRGKYGQSLTPGPGWVQGSTVSFRTRQTGVGETAWPSEEGDKVMREFHDGGERSGGELVRDEKSGVTRREFLEMGVAATLAVGAEKMAWAGDAKSEVPRRTLGRTGEKVSMVGLGGYHIGNQRDEQESVRIIRTAV